MCKIITNIIRRHHYLYYHTYSWNNACKQTDIFLSYLFFLAKWFVDIRIVLIINYWYYNLVNEYFSTAFNPCHRLTMNWKLYITSFSILYLLAEDTLLLFLSTNNENNFLIILSLRTLLQIHVVQVHSNSIITEDLKRSFWSVNNMWNSV